MGAGAQVLDGYYLAITAIITIAYQLFFFAIAFTLKFDKLTDFAGGTNFFLLAILTLGLSGARDNARNVVASLCLAVWALRLSGFLLFRILKTGKDDRFDDKRDKFFPFLGFWVFQMLWVWTVSLPVTILNSPKVAGNAQPDFGTGCDVAGLILYVIGLVMECVSDVQKYRFRSAHRNDGAVCDAGLFSWSRHPNYFGEIIIQFGIFTLCVSPAAYSYVSGGPSSALYASVLGAFFLTILLMFVSGLPLQERPGAKKRYEKGTNWDAYVRWLHRTSILVPFPPRLYAPLPVALKRTLFLEFPMYVFDPAKHADPDNVRDASRDGEVGRTADPQSSNAT